MTIRPDPDASHTALHPAEAHLWSVLAARSFHSADALLSELAPSEVERAARFSTPAARQRFVTDRSVLRRILASYVGRPAAALVIETHDSGKPGLAGEPDLHFSLSHSADLTLVAVARVPVGIDVEHERPLRRMRRVADRILHPSTADRLRALSEPDRTVAFLDAWTLREAHVKAVGGGLFRTPDTLPCDATHEPTGAIRLVRDRDGVSEWSVVRFSPAPGARAAVVARGILERVRFFNLNGDHPS